MQMRERERERERETLQINCAYAFVGVLCTASYDKEKGILGAGSANEERHTDASRLNELSVLVYVTGTMYASCQRQKYLRFCRNMKQVTAKLRAIRDIFLFVVLPLQCSELNCAQGSALREREKEREGGEARA